MSKSVQAIPVFLRAPYAEALRRQAAELGVKDAALAARLLEDALAPKLANSDVADQRRAERELLGIAGQLAREESGRTEWNERLALAVFERIRNDHLDLYRRSTAGGAADSVNRRLGRQIRQSAGAAVKMRDGKPMTAKSPRGSEALITSYTLLVPART